MNGKDDPNLTVEHIPAGSTDKRLDGIIRRHGGKVTPTHVKCAVPGIGKWGKIKDQLANPDWEPQPIPPAGQRRTPTADEWHQSSEVRRRPIETVDPL